MRRRHNVTGDPTATTKLPTSAEALSEPFSAFPSWFMRIECDRCGKVRMINEAHMKWSDMLIRDIIARCATAVRR